MEKAGVRGIRIKIAFLDFYAEIKTEEALMPSQVT
jgi:hypothetical protein